MSSEVERLADFVSSAGRIVVFTGAGVSTESGIPDFRSPGGGWDRFDPNEFTFQNFIGSEEGRRRYWELGRTVYPVVKRAEPNRAIMPWSRCGGSAGSIASSHRTSTTCTSARGCPPSA